MLITVSSLALVAARLKGLIETTRPHSDPNVPVVWPIRFPPQPVWVDGTYPHVGDFVD